MTAAPAIFAARPSVAEQILECFPCGSYAFAALLRLLDIVESDSVETAAVECRAEPRLLVNSSFVARHANTPEKLFMLVMHELHHVLLGHTTLFPAVTPTHNFIFDAVINGLLCRMFPAREHTALFTDFYDARNFPMCLLRPPPGWPERKRTVASGIAKLPEAHRRRAAEVHAALYSEAGATYLEVAEVLPEVLSACGAGDAAGEVPLLGGHGEHSSTMGGLEHRSPLLFDIVRGLVEQWPQPPDPIQGRSLADVIATSKVIVRRKRSNRVVLRRIIEKVAAQGTDGQVRRRALDRVAAQSPLPGFDRRALVQGHLGFQPLLYQREVPWMRARPAADRVHVYLDVSGSMEAVKGALYGAILDCYSHVYPTVHLFSTAVEDVSIPELRRGVCKSTGGTDIACVASHIAKNGISRALVVTDGWVGRPSGEHLAILSRTKLAVALFGPSTQKGDLEPVADHLVELERGDRT
jgi:hypothetical protein